MLKSLAKYPEIRIFAVLGSIALGWHLLTIFGSFLLTFADIFLLVVLSWILAFILEPIVNRVASYGLARTWSAAVVYLGLTLAAALLIGIMLPTTIAQLSQLSTLIPLYLPSDSLWSAHIADFLNTTVANSAPLASGLASTATNILLTFILSFYFLISRATISKFLRDIIPDQYEDDYLFLEKTFNTTFASFLRIQVFLGLMVGLTTWIVLMILGIGFALSTAMFSAILAMIPVVGSVLFVIPVILAALTVSFQKMVIAVIVLVIAAQLIYNLLAPKLLGSALNIHPIIVLLSFLIGYRLMGVWGAIFAVPVTSAGAIVGQELLKYWKEAADKN